VWEGWPQGGWTSTTSSATPGGTHPNSVAVVALDLDDFKLINGSRGHAAGDAALRTVAAALRDELRAGDVCGRVGGDEFMLALIDADVGTADLIVDRVRARVEAASLGVSAGIVTFPRHGTAQDELLHLAAGAVYWAKSHGKARTFVYSDAIDFAKSAEEAAERNLRAGLVNTVHALARADRRQGRLHALALPARGRLRGRARPPHSAYARSGSSSCAPPASCTTSARSASPTWSCSSPPSSTPPSSRS
jgi:diguanylate cyclase (GGDEF)-like protein